VARPDGYGIWAEAGQRVPFLLEYDNEVFSVSGAKAVLATEITLAEAGIKEREHLQNGVLAPPP
jgi:hypothetical protein